MFKEIFIEAIHSKAKVNVTFFSKQDGAVIERKCAPVDYGPSRRAKLKNDRYHLWNYEGDDGPHIMSLPTEQVHGITVLDEYFDPSEFVTWDPDWRIPRDWGRFS